MQPPSWEAALPSLSFRVLKSQILFFPKNQFALETWLDSSLHSCTFPVFWQRVQLLFRWIPSITWERPPGLPKVVVKRRSGCSKVPAPGRACFGKAESG